MKYGQLSLISAGKKDCRLLWKWKNEKGVRESAFDSRFIPYEEHKQWFEEKLKSLNTKILILLDFRKREVGQARFDINYKEVAEIDISIDKNERAKGYGTKGLELACRYAFNNLKIKKVKAHIKEDNRVSLNVFTKAGFINDGLKEFKNHQCYEMSLDSDQFRGKPDRNFVGQEGTMVDIKRRYIVATIKPWNEKLFKEKISKFPGIWKLINNPNELKFKIISEFNPRYIFFIHWSNKVPKETTDNFECVCFHMTDLPYGGGGSPLQNLIARGHTETVIPAIRMVQEIDAGPIYYKRPLSLVGNAEEIFIRAGQTIADMIHELIEKEPEPVPQQEKTVIFKRRCPWESRIPKDANLEKAFDWIRMLDAEGYPPAFVTVGNLRIEFKRAALRYNIIEADARITFVSKKK